MLGKWAGRFKRFPLLLKFLDVRNAFSVQVHPSDGQTSYLPSGETGKTEAWVVLEAGSKSRIYAGLKPGSTADGLRRAIANKTLAEDLACFTPKPGNAVLVPAGTVHSLNDVVVFEVQENSDVTFRLYDWDHVDPKTGQSRPLQVDQALACIDFAQGAKGPVVPVVQQEMPVERERLLCCEHFGLSRIRGEGQFPVGAAETPRMLVCIAGHGQLEHAGTDYGVRKGDVFPLAGCGRSVPLPPARRDDFAGHFTAGRERERNETTHCFRPGWHPCPKQSLDRRRDGQIAQRSAWNRKSGDYLRRQLAAI